MRYYGACTFDEEIYEYVAQNSMHLCGTLSGITFPDPKYEIIRRLSPVYSIEYIYSGEGVIQEKDVYKRQSYYRIRKGKAYKFAVELCFGVIFRNIYRKEHRLLGRRLRKPKALHPNIAARLNRQRPASEINCYYIKAFPRSDVYKRQLVRSLPALPIPDFRHIPFLNSAKPYPYTNQWI